MSTTSITEDPEIPVAQTTWMRHSSVGSYLEPESEAIHLVNVEWWIEEIRLNIEPKWESVGGKPLQVTQMAALRPSELSKKIVRDYVGLTSSDPLPNLPNRSSMNVMLWNCRGAGNKISRRNFRELVRLHHPNVVALFETKVLFSSMGLFFNHLRYTASTIVDPVGRVGSIWLIWDPTQVSVSVQIANSQLIQVTVKRENYEEWVLAAVYASPNLGIRQNVWNDLENTSSSMVRPWLIAGDFNDIMGQNERRSYSQNNQSYRCRKFLDNINRCGLMDIGCSGPKFTWSNNRHGMANTRERLDRALCNVE
ncbi:hypothetical protein ACSBR2_002690 [Camellia fascicularis]